jgi:hypothetical protein
VRSLELLKQGIVHALGFSIVVAELRMRTDRDSCGVLGFVTVVHMAPDSVSLGWSIMKPSYVCAQVCRLTATAKEALARSAPRSFREHILRYGGRIVPFSRRTSRTPVLRKK